MVSQTNTNRGRGQRDRRGRKDEEKSPYIEKVVSVRRVSKVVKGGRNLSFAAFVVIGDEKGKVGYSSGKAAAVPSMPSPPHVGSAGRSIRYPCRSRPGNLQCGRS